MSFLLNIIFSLLMAQHTPCPIEINVENTAICVEILWQQGEKKSKGQFQTVSKQSPFLIPMKQIQKKWVYSTAQVKLWEKSDLSQQSIKVPKLRIFPYMHMANGHHHGIHSKDYQFHFDSSTETYQLQRAPFHEMRGCWTLRWSLNSLDHYNRSELLSTVVDFSNIKDDTLLQQQTYCDDLVK